MGRSVFIVVLSTTYELRIDLTSLKIEKTQETTMVVADLDGTLLHDGETFEERFLTQRSIDVINRMHDNGRDLRCGNGTSGQHRLFVRGKTAG